MFPAQACHEPPISRGSPYAVLPTPGGPKMNGEAAGHSDQARIVADRQRRIWEALGRSHSIIFTTLRRDGSPVALPVWFVTMGDHLYIRTTRTSKKALRVSRDHRASILAESGKFWTELRAIHYGGYAEILADDHPDSRASLDALAVKYAQFEPPYERLPEEVQRNYATGNNAIIRFTPSSPPLSWDNSRVPLRPE